MTKPANAKSPQASLRDYDEVSRPHCDYFLQERICEICRKRRIHHILSKRS